MKQFILRRGATLFTVLLFAILMTGGSAGYAQRTERIHNIKVEYLTDRLKLSTEQARNFWPVYDEYEAELRKTRVAFRMNKRQQAAPTNDAEATRIIDDNLDYQEAVLGINKRYRDRFLKVISPSQLATLYDAERDFRKMLLQQLKDRRGK